LFVSFIHMHTLTIERTASKQPHRFTIRMLRVYDYPRAFVTDVYSNDPHHLVRFDVEFNEEVGEGVCTYQAIVQPNHTRIRTIVDQVRLRHTHWYSHKWRKRYSVLNFHEYDAISVPWNRKMCHTLLTFTARLPFASTRLLGHHHIRSKLKYVREIRLRTICNSVCSGNLECRIERRKLLAWQLSSESYVGTDSRTTKHNAL
jgi:hypothetical protein